VNHRNEKILIKPAPTHKFLLLNRIIATLCVSALSTAPSLAADLFVATTGVDNITSHDGSISQPWASLDFALAQVAAGDTINIRAGRYREAITRTDVSGTAKQPITIASYNGEKVTFDGTVTLNGTWTQHSGNIYKLQLAEPVWQLFVDDELMVNARWPNARFDDDSMYSRAGWAKGLDATTTNGHFDTDPTVHDLAATNLDVTGAVVIANTRHFETYTRAVTSHAAGSNAFDHGITPFFWGSKSYYYLQAKLNLLDQDKEWHIDATNNMAYLWAPGGGAPTGKIRGRNQQFAIDASNWNYVTFKGLNFFATNIQLKASESITIEDCHFNYGGASKRPLGETATQSSALRLTNEVGGGNFVIRNSTITNSDSQALWIKGENSIVENSLFENIDWSATQRIAPGSNLVFKGGNTLFRRNTIHNAGASESVATALEVTASNITAEYNHLYNNGYAQSDGAMIQIRIDAQDAQKYGFRFDAPIVAPRWGNNGYSHHNVVWNTRGANPKGDNDRHYNNLLFDNQGVDLIVLDEQAANGDWSNEFTNTINNAADSISGHRVNQVAVPGTVSSNFNGVKQTQPLKSLLRDPANHDFRPIPGSSLVDGGEVISDADFSHPTQGAAPDVGTYEDGNTNYWIPGRQTRAASYPIPFNAGSTTRTNSDLMWRQGYSATSYNVYFGSTSGALVSGGNQTNNIFDPGALTVGQTYYWRVDAVTPTGIIIGDEWSFLVDVADVTVSLNPTADAYVDDNLPNTNKGNDSVIRLVTPVTVGGAYQQRFGFLKFDVDVPGTVISAKLKLYNPLGAENKKVNVHAVADTSWAETLITWNNQPPMGASLQELNIEGSTWQEFDVLSAISGNGLLSLGLKRAPLDSRRELASRESAFIPELIIEYTPAGRNNKAPVFTADPFSKNNALQGAVYSASIATDATDADGDPLTFDIVSGPAWLSVAADGSLLGTPGAGDVGANVFIVDVSDSNGLSAVATMNIVVDAPVSTLFSDDMNSGLGAWTIVGTAVSSKGGAYSGSKGARIKSSSLIRTNIDTTGFNSITLSYDRRTKNFDSGEELLVQWYDGSGWHTLEQTNDTAWASTSFVLPAGADDNAKAKIRFKTNADSSIERGDIDNVRVTGISN